MAAAVGENLPLAEGGLLGVHRDDPVARRAATPLAHEALVGRLDARELALVRRGRGRGVAARSETRRAAALGRLQISITPPGFDVPDKAMVDAYAAAGVDRLILRPRPEMDAGALERFAAETGRALGLKG